MVLLKVRFPEKKALHKIEIACRVFLAHITNLFIYGIWVYKIALNIYLFIYLKRFFLVTMGIEPQVFSLLGKHSTTKVHF